GRHPTRAQPWRQKEPGDFAGGIERDRYGDLTASEHMDGDILGAYDRFRDALPDRGLGQDAGKDILQFRSRKGLYDLCIGSCENCRCIPSGTELNDLPALRAHISNLSATGVRPGERQEYDKHGRDRVTVDDVNDELRPTASHKAPRGP